MAVEYSFRNEFRLPADATPRGIGLIYFANILSRF
jgi:hypothetical protein